MSDIGVWDTLSRTLVLQQLSTSYSLHYVIQRVVTLGKLDDGWPESEKDVFQAALSMVVVKKSRWMVGELYMSYGG